MMIEGFFELMGILLESLVDPRTDKKGRCPAKGMSTDGRASKAWSPK